MDIETAIGLGALASVLVGIIKKTGVIPDGKAGLVAVAANVLIFAVLQFGGALGWDLRGIDSLAGALAKVAELAAPVIASVAGSLGTHKVARALLG